ncbi:MAG: Fic family protein [Phycisphaerales bacterium]|jgi:Fic family protein|nr:Fic family protein [Phycisphaerales bacterium]
MEIYDIITVESAVNMQYIYQLQDWPDFRWDSEVLSSELARVRHEQGILLGRMNSLGFELRSEATLLSLTEEVIKTSAIEGENLHHDEVRSSIANKLGLDVGGVLPSSRDVDGVVEMMLDATQNFEAPLTQERLFGWHSLLFPFGRSGMHKITVGNWRTDVNGPMQVVSGVYGKERVHFVAPDAEKLQQEMDMFIDWFNSNNENDPVIKSAIAHLWFVTIHPFADGNGRIARAIADMALARSDGTKDRYYSMSSGIESERNQYYHQLEFTQRSSLDITSWLTWFLQCFGRVIDEAENSVKKVLFKAKVWEHANKHSTNDRQRKVINRLLENFEGKLTTSKFAKLAKCSNDTALRDINELVTCEILKKNEGGGRSTSYSLIEH